MRPFALSTFLPGFFGVSCRMTKRRRLAVYAGSFDPITLGHLWMIERGVEMFDRLIVAIGTNPAKKSTFTLPERTELLKLSTRHLRKLEIASLGPQFLIRYAHQVGAGFILRGIRTESDYEYERAMRNINGDFDPAITTVFLMPPREIVEISSSMVKGLVGPEGWQDTVKRFVPAPVHAKLLERFRES